MFKIWQSPPTNLPPYEVGTDLVFVPDVVSSVKVFGERYLDFIFTKDERADCEGKDGINRFLSYAARLALKEAALKVLAPGRNEAIPWKSIEVIKGQSDKKNLRLANEAQKKAEHLGFRFFTMSLAHEQDYASAVVIGMR